VRPLRREDTRERSSTGVDGRDARFGYQPSLDGVRAAAIIAVMIFHVGWHASWLAPTGYLGVDMFFVLSGFLITMLLLQEWQRNRQIVLRHFYVRRALRLLPVVAVVTFAAAVVHVVTSPSFSGWAPWRIILSTIFYCQNWVSRWTADAGGMLAHVWSLSIEEQFYLVWPPILVAMLYFGARKKATIAVLVAGVGSVVVVRSVRWLDVFDRAYRHNGFGVLHHTHELSVAWSDWYSSTFQHGDGLLVGCLAAAVVFWFPAVRRVPRWIATVATIPALYVVAAMMHSSDASYSRWLPVWGLPLFNVAVAIVIVSFVLHPVGVVARVFAVRPVVWIGRRSYGLYVYHWPLVVLLGHTGWSKGAVAFTVYASAVAAAALSYRFIERPILAWKQRYSGRAKAAPAPAPGAEELGAARLRAGELS
jgi:peptidoglycan/LPS O-acetylase OafA/YrhL